MISGGPPSVGDLESNNFRRTIPSRRSANAKDCGRPRSGKDDRPPLHGISTPSDSAMAAANRVYSDATQLQKEYLELAKSTSVRQYQQMLASTGIDQHATQFNTDYQNLGKAFGVS
jgi:hypothetical protein